MTVFAATLEAIETDHGLRKPTGKDPAAKVPGVILKSMLLFANAAVGKARATSVKAISRRLIPNTPWDGFGPLFNEAQTVRNLFRLQVAVLNSFPAKYYWLLKEMARRIISKRPDRLTSLTSCVLNNLHFRHSAFAELIV